LLLGTDRGELDDWLYDDIVNPRNRPADFVQVARGTLEAGFREKYSQ
jgi:hypothetical protein